jgi:hypothetical protein
MALGQNQKRPALFVYLDNAVVVIDGMTILRVPLGLRKPSLRTTATPLLY